MSGYDMLYRILWLVWYELIVCKLCVDSAGLPAAVGRPLLLLVWYDI